jgi:glycosyltransferase involved in cell wall biosynthesis
MTDCIVFWQRMLTPHMTALAREVARLGVEVHYAAEDELSHERRAMGWQVGDLTALNVHYVSTPEAARGLVDCMPPKAIHVTQGVRANGIVGHAQRQIMAKKLRQYPIMEKVDLRGRFSWIKPVVYARQFHAISSRTEGLLAIGDTTPDWVSRLAPRSLRVIPFAYFLESKGEARTERSSGAFKFVFVGELTKRKRVDLLINALSAIANRSFEIEIVGDGPDRNQLEALANESLPGRVTFLGTIEMNATIDLIGRADCLVLPSDHDGWGAVVSEAQINGTPAICSSECGAAGTVRSSGIGSVFAAGDVGDLRRALTATLDQGAPDSATREKLAIWAQSLTAVAGARYLLEIIDGSRDTVCSIAPPWQKQAADGDCR